MFFYLSFIAVVVLIWIYLNKRDREFALSIIGILLVLLMGFRSEDIGPDTFSYCYNFINGTHVGIENLTSFYIGNMNYGFNLFNEITYIILPKNYTLYLLIISAVITSALLKFIRKFSSNYLLSFILVFSLGFIFFFMSGIKQTLAMSFILLAYIEFYDNKIKNSIIWIIIASLFHNTAMIVLPALLITKIDFKRKYILYSLITLFFVFIFKENIASLLQLFLYSGKYAVYGNDYSSSNNLTGFFIQLVIFLVTVGISWYRINSDKKLKYFIPLYLFGMSFQLMTPVIAEFFRVSMYFSIIGIVMLPHAIDISNIKGKFWSKFCCNTIFIIYFIISNYNNTRYLPYIFFWE